jgi:pyruvate dehydrogenase E2 component (dihydrolipoamide acetyltransferase)
MPIEITMPRLSDTMETGTIIKWNVKDGDAVESGAVVADVETDKATMELSVYDDGTVAKILVPEGETVDVGTPIAIMAEDDEDVSEIAATAGSAPAPAEPAPVIEEPTPAAPIERDKLRVSPVARRLAEEHKIDLNIVQGSGPNGRVIKRDVLKAIESAAETTASVPPSAAPAAAPAAEREIITSITPSGATTIPSTPVPMTSGIAPSLPARREELSSMRQTIARRLVESKTTIPHYQVTVTFDMDPVMELRKTLNEQLAPIGVKLSVNDFLMRCCALAMYQHPDFNASWDGDAIVYHADVNIGMAISVGPERGGGLVVGVVRNADQKSLRAISQESKALAEKARTRGLAVEDMSDSTFTLSNLGMFGVEHFTAIINPPNSAILAVGAALQKPVVRDGELTVGHEMSATLSSDHRVIDGAMAAQYLQTLKNYLENPATLMV